MSRVEDYVQASERPNTTRNYASAIKHFEQEWRGFLPSTSDMVARYLADHAKTHSINTLRQRLAALSRWHIDQGFVDPTKTALVRQVLKGIRAVHPAAEKRARPLELELLQKITDWLDSVLDNARRQGDTPLTLRLARDRSLLLLVGFWRGFRADELVHVRVDNVQVAAGEGLTCYLDRSKGDRQLEGRSFKCPALSRLCPVMAYVEWVALSGLATNPPKLRYFI